MTKNAAFFVAIFVATALFIGITFNQYRGSSADLAARLAQAEALTKARGRYFARLVLLCVLSAAVLYVLAKKHHHG
ncbi:MAG TPA: hypothetical protein VF843_10775 [Streptosporangiaceae bacterium]